MELPSPPTKEKSSTSMLPLTAVKQEEEQPTGEKGDQNVTCPNLRTKEEPNSAMLLEESFSQISISGRGAPQAEERPFPCLQCSKRFARSSCRVLHEKKIHIGAQTYKCPDCCSKTFPAASTFVKHSKIHTGFKPYKCSLCGKYFRSKPTLQDHRRIHTGEKPYRCAHCGETFRKKTNLEVHQRMLIV